MHSSTGDNVPAHINTAADPPPLAPLHAPSTSTNTTSASPTSTAAAAAATAGVDAALPSSLPTLKPTAPNARVPPARDGGAAAAVDSAPPSSDFYAFLTRQKNSLLSLFDSGRAAQRTSSSPPPPPTASSNAAAGASRSDERSFEDFLSYLALPGVYSKADAVLEHHAARMGIPLGTENTTETSPCSTGDASKSSALSAMAPASIHPPPPPSFESAAASSARPDHVHQLRPTQFFVPTICDVCRRAVLDTKVWPPPAAAPRTSASAPSFFSRFLMSPTSAPLQPASSQSSASPPAHEHPSAAAPTSAAVTKTTTAPAAASAATPVQQPFLGFGSDGYHCEMCDMALHRQCLRKLRETQACVVLAPVAHEMPEEAAKTDTAAANSGSSGGAFSWDTVKSLLGNYLDPSDGTNSRKDANVKLVLNGVYALLDTVAERYPDLSPMTLVKRRQAIQDLSVAHQTLYTACTASLVDSALLHAITWDAVEHREAARMACKAPKNAAGETRKGKGGYSEDEDEDEDRNAASGLLGVSLLTREMHPVKMDSSLFSQLTASLSGTASTGPDMKAFLPAFAHSASSQEITGPGASFPVQLLLWRAVRYATAVYGEVYRRGSLSSTVSAALLFTVNRSRVDVSKEANDAAVTSLLELPPSSLRLSRWAAQATEPSYVLLVDHALGHIVVAFRGTLNTFDIMTDLAAVGVPFCGGYAHQGAAHVVNTLFDHRSSRYAAAATRPPPPPSSSASNEAAPAASAVEVKKTVDAKGAVKVVLEPYAIQALETPDGLLDGLEQLAGEYPTYSILVTGHSLGGGVAVLFATRLHHDRVFPESLLRRLHVVAFAPMPSLSLPAASCFDAVSCDRADGGFDGEVRPSAAPDTPNGRGRRQETPAEKPIAATAAAGKDVRQACFPVWSVVNGFDCVPRLQVNTIDHLIRQVVGPQLASGAAASEAAGAKVGKRDRGQRHESNATGEEMIEMMATPPPPAATAVAPASGAGRDAGLQLVVPLATPHDGEAVLPIDFTASPQQDQHQQHGGHPAPNASCSVSVVLAERPAIPGSPLVGEAGTVANSGAASDKPDIVVQTTAAAAAGASTPRQGSALEKAAPALSAAVTAAAREVHKAASSMTTEAAAATSKPQHDLSHELHHPGRVLLMTSPWETSQNRLVDVPRGHPVMHELFLMKLMLLQHSVDAYCGALTEIHSKQTE